MQTPSVLPAPRNWPSAIGNFLLNFGSLDYAVFVFLKDHLPSEEFERVREQHFKDRALRIRKILEGEEYGPEQRSAFDDLLQRIEPMRMLRNDLAHGHLLATVEPKTAVVSITVFNPKDVDVPIPKSIPFDDVVSASNLLRSLIDILHGIVGFVPQLSAVASDGVHSSTMFTQQVAQSNDGPPITRREGRFR